MAQKNDGYNLEKDDECMKDTKFFNGSSHQLALYYHENPNKNGCLIAIIVIIIQFVLLCICTVLLTDDISGDEFTIPVKVRFGQSCNGSDYLS